MKSIKKCIAGLMVVSMFLGLTACGKIEEIKKNYTETYIFDYVSAVLDNGYKNDSAKLVKLGLGTAEEAAKIYAEGVEQEIVGVTRESSTEAEKQEWRDIMSRVLGSVKYSVKSVTANGDETFKVVLGYEQLRLFENILPQYTEKMMEIQESLAAESANDDEYYSKIMAVYREYFREALKNPQYQSEAEFEFNIGKNSDGLYEITLDCRKQIENLLIDTNFAYTFTPPEQPTVKDYGVVLGNYKGLEATRSEIKVTDEDVMLYIYEGLSDLAVATNRKNVKLYDIVDIIYEGTIPGLGPEEMDMLGELSGSYEGILIGSGYLFEDLEKGIIGATVGTKASVTLTVPDNYSDEFFAGKTVIYGVVVTGIKAVPELTDKFVTDLGIEGVQNFEQLKEFARLSLEIDAEDEVEEIFRDDILDALIENCSFDDTLDEEAKLYADAFKSQCEETAKSNNMTLEEYVYEAYSISLDKFELEILDASKREACIRRALLAVADAEEIICTDDEVESYIEDIKNYYGYESVEDVLLDYPFESIREDLLQDRALLFVLGNAVVK